MRQPWVGFEGDHLRVDYGLELLCRQGSELHGDHDVCLAVALQDGDVFVAVRCLRHRHSRLNTPCCVETPEQEIKAGNCPSTEGKLLWSGSQQLRATTPAICCWQVKAVYKDRAPPCGDMKDTK